MRYGRWLGVLTGVLHDPLQDPELKLDFKDPRGDRYFGNFGYSTLFKAPVNDVICGTGSKQHRAARRHRLRA